VARRIAVLIGNGRFTSESRLSDLAGPANDVRSLGELLGSTVGGFEVQPFVDADNHTLQRVIEGTLNGVGSDDLVLIYFSGHGKLDSRGHLCLATTNTSLDTLRSTSLPVSFVKSVIDDCRSDQVVLMLDCCFSGAAGKSFGGIRSTVEDQLSATRGAGLHILTSSTAIETSKEREHDQSGEVLGNFTRCIVEGIRSGDADMDNDSRITLSDLHTYMERRIRGQSPKYWGFDTSGEIVIATNEKLRPAALPPELVSALASPLAGVREGVARELARLLESGHKGLVLAARNALSQLAADDSRRVSEAAAAALAGHASEQPVARPAPPAPPRDESPKPKAANAVPAPLPAAPQPKLDVAPAPEMERPLFSTPQDGPPAVADRWPPRVRYCTIGLAFVVVLKAVMDLAGRSTTALPISVLISLLPLLIAFAPAGRRTRYGKLVNTALALTLLSSAAETMDMYVGGHSGPTPWLLFDAATGGALAVGLGVGRGLVKLVPYLLIGAVYFAVYFHTYFAGSLEYWNVGALSVFALSETGMAAMLKAVAVSALAGTAWEHWREAPDLLSNRGALGVALWLASDLVQIMMIFRLATNGMDAVNLMLSVVRVVMFAAAQWCLAISALEAGEGQTPAITPTPAATPV